MLCSLVKQLGLHLVCLLLLQWYKDIYEWCTTLAWLNIFFRQYFLYHNVLCAHVCTCHFPERVEKIALLPHDPLLSLKSIKIWFISGGKRVLGLCKQTECSERFCCTAVKFPGQTSQFPAQEKSLSVFPWGCHHLSCQLQISFWPPLSHYQSWKCTAPLLTSPHLTDRAAECRILISLTSQACMMIIWWPDGFVVIAIWGG